MLVRRADLRTLEVSERKTWSRVWSRESRQFARARVFTAGLQQQRQRQQQQPEITVDKLVFSYKSLLLLFLKGVGVSAHTATQGELLPRRWVNHVQRALGTLQLLTFRPCDTKTTRHLLLHVHSDYNPTLSRGV